MPSKQASKRSETSRIDSATAALWRERRDMLHDKLEEQEQTEWTWLWCTRISVLNYLIHRYDNTLETTPRRESSVRGDVSQSRNTTGDDSEEPISPYNQTPVDGTAWIADQKREAIQNRLNSLKSANVERHAEGEKLAESLREVVRVWQRWREQDEPEQTRAAKSLNDMASLIQQPEQQTKPEDADKLRMAEALSELDEREHKELRRYIAFDLGVLEYTDEPLDDETIRQILTEHGIAPGQPD